MEVYTTTLSASAENPSDAMEANFFGNMTGFLNYGDGYCEAKADSFSVFFNNPFDFKTSLGDDQFYAPQACSLIYPPQNPPDSDFSHLFSSTTSDSPIFSCPDWSSSSPGLSSDSRFEPTDPLSPLSSSDTSSCGNTLEMTAEFELDFQRAISVQRTDVPADIAEQPGSPKRSKKSSRKHDLLHKDSVSTVSTSLPAGAVVKKRRGRPRVENTELRQARHRERNRLAASRCRVKQRRRTNDLEVRAAEMEAQNAQLLRLKDELREQVLRLQAVVLEHKSGCNCRSKTGRNNMAGHIAQQPKQADPGNLRNGDP